jgi:hypothetical protein
VYDTQVLLPTGTPERTALVFLGWNTSPDGRGISFAPGDTVFNLTKINESTVTLYAQWEKRKFIMVKSAKTGWADYLIKRTTGDDEWYNLAGRMTISELEACPEELCEAVWHIDKYGNITQLK